MKSWCNYKRNLEKGFIGSLIIITSIFIISKRISYQNASGSRKNVPAFTVENIPKTRQNRTPKKPERPAIPIPVESEAIPDDATIEPTNLSFDFDIGEPPGWAGAGNDEPDIPPRPIAEVFPEYPEEELKNGIQGIVKLYLQVDTDGKVIEIVVLENTTASKRCEKAARQAAFKSRFFPARKNNIAVAAWIIKSYSFFAAK
ncbi:energy transducer TonB [candidate division KSB1 bacterium]|nr:energy transducer TonB [candidate division KSB1 bacterium]